MKIAGLMALFGRKRSCSEDKEHNKRNNRIYNSVHDTQRPLLVLTIKRKNFPSTFCDWFSKQEMITYALCFGAQKQIAIIESDKIRPTSYVRSAPTTKEVCKHT